jgi:hypothetical protein
VGNPCHYPHRGAGKTAGKDHWNYKTGEFIAPSPNLPVTTLSEMAARILREDQDPSNMRREMAYLRARLGQLENRIDNSNLEVAQGKVEKAHQKLEHVIEFPRDKNAPRSLRAAYELLQEALEPMTIEVNSFIEIRQTMGLLNSLAGTEINREKVQRDFVHNSQLVIILGRVQDTVLRYLKDDEDRQGFQSEMREIMSRPINLIDVDSSN